MKKDNLRSLDPTEADVKLREIDEQAFRIKFQMSMGQSDGLRKLREMRKDRARLLTYRRERAIAAGPKAVVTGKVGAVAKEGAKK
jgi:large subunit ribosomal protein L29